MVDWAARREDWHVVEPVTVWMVHLGLGDGRKAAEVRGTLTLGNDGLEFVERKTGADVRFDYTSIQRAKRVRGSPVLLVDWRRGEESRKTAFYFSQPPPLEPVPRTATIEPRGPLGSLHASDAFEATGGADEPRLPPLDEHGEARTS